MRGLSRGVLLAIAAIIVLLLVWQRLRIHVVIPLSLGQAALVLGISILVLYVVLDHLVNRTRR